MHELTRMHEPTNKRRMLPVQRPKGIVERLGARSGDLQGFTALCLVVDVSFRKRFSGLAVPLSFQGTLRLEALHVAR